MAAAAVSFSGPGVRLDEAAIHGCCASPRFVQALARAAPYADLDALIAEARRIWWQDCGVGEWLAAFAAHPKIGQKKEGLQGDASSAVFASFSKSEQSAAAQSTTDQVAQELLLWNQRYDEKFGFIFIICARGRSSPDILAVLKQRYQRMAHEELLAAAQEQMRITELRLTAMYNERAAGLPGGAQPTSTTTPEAQARMQRRAEQVLNQVVAAHTSGPLRSPITTHVLDASLGRPAKGLPITLLKQEAASKSWEAVSSGLTNDDGRIGNLLPPGNYVTPGRYRMHFDTATYLAACRQQHPAFYSAAPFYPEVTVDFEITADKATEHYHIPLLFSPYSYSTYRGS